MAIDDHSSAAIAEQHQMMVDRAVEAGLTLVGDPFLFSDALDGSRPWRPGAITLYVRRLRQRLELDHLTCHTVRKLMETYGQDLGFSPVQVAIRAGHDPAVATKHYTGKVDQTDRELAAAVASLLVDRGS